MSIRSKTKRGPTNPGTSITGIGRCDVLKFSRPRVGVLDTGVGNVLSVMRALQSSGAEVELISPKLESLSDMQGFVLPGVGHFGYFSGAFDLSDLCEYIRELESCGVPTLGICLGGQLLFETSEESPGSSGLGLLEGKVVRLPQSSRNRVPHVGWASTTPVPDTGAFLFNGLKPGTHFYFSHSYNFLPAKPEECIALTEHTAPFCSIAGSRMRLAVQFHPEKSGKNGKKFLANWMENFT